MEKFWAMVLIFTGGGLGSVCRYLLDRMITRQILDFFPIGTLTVNLIGSFLIGFLFIFFERNSLNTTAKLFLTTGFLGGFTTFSTFTFESVNLLRNSHYAIGLINVICSLILGLLFVALGILIGSFLWKGNSQV